MNHCECKIEGKAAISAERYSQLIRLENVAVSLMALIEEKYEHYQGLSYDELKMLVTMFIGIKED